MYIDYLKQDYKDKPENERDAYIERDKKCIGNIIREKIANDIENIVNRYYEFDDVGYIEINEKFLDLLKEAEQSYYFGYYVGSIAIVGITAEEFCKFMVESKNVTDTDKQVDRINLLTSKKIISVNQQKNLHKIRKIRNKCMHYNLDFKNLAKDELKNHAYEMLSLFKECLQPLSKEIKEDEMINAFCTNDCSSMKEFVFRNRNVVKKLEKLDMQINSRVDKLLFTAYYYIAEIDIESEQFKEFTVFDLNRKLLAVIDLTLPQAEKIVKMKLQEGNIMLASCIATVADTGMTEEWQLLDIHDIYHGVIELNKLDSIAAFF